MDFNFTGDISKKEAISQLSHVYDLDFDLKEKDTKYTRVWSKKESADNNYMTMLYRNLMSNIFGEEYSKKSSTMLDKQM